MPARLPPIHFQKRFRKSESIKFAKTAIFSTDDNGTGGDTTDDILGDAKLAELTDTKIPGYVYISNDIDEPEGGFSNALGPNARYPFDPYTSAYDLSDGNGFLSPAVDADGNLLAHKHYYLTYRAVPLVLKIIHVDAKDMATPIEGATFAVYSVDAAGHETLVKKGLTTLADGTVVLAKDASLKTVEGMVKKLDGYDEKTQQYSNALGLYLPAGAYVVRQTTAADGCQPSDAVMSEFEVPTGDDVTVTVTVPGKQAADKPAESRKPAKLPKTGA